MTYRIQRYLPHRGSWVSLERNVRSIETAQRNAAVHATGRYPVRIVEESTGRVVERVEAVR